MRTTYAELVIRSEQARRLDRATRSPLLGFVLGVGLALLLWIAIGWTVVAVLG